MLGWGARCSAHLWQILTYLNTIWSRKTHPDVTGYWVTGYLIAAGPTVPSSLGTDIYFATPPHLQWANTQGLLGTNRALPPLFINELLHPLLQPPWWGCCLSEIEPMPGGHSKPRARGSQITTPNQEAVLDPQTKGQNRVVWGNWCLMGSKSLLRPSQSWASQVVLFCSKAGIDVLWPLLFPIFSSSFHTSPLLNPDISHLHLKQEQADAHNQIFS